MTYDFGVFIGRFQPLHIGHTHIIDEALKQVSRLIIVVGSTGAARDPKNPFTFEERKATIEAAYRYQVKTGRVIVVGVSDYHDDNEAWAEAVHDVVRPIAAPDGGLSYVTKSIALAGYGKDASSFYLKLFPDWSNIQIQAQKGTLNSTDIRQAYFKNLPVWPREVLPPAANDFLDEFRWTDAFKPLVAEAAYYKRYPKLWGKGPFVTADSIITHRGEVLLVTRGELPGKGLLAMPGGFRELYERLDDAALRELKQETGLILTPAAIQHSYMVDTPYRSLRGDVLTWVIAHELTYEFDRSKLKAGYEADHPDEVKAIGWFRFKDLRPDQFFDDHWSILNNHFIAHDMTEHAA